MTREIEFRAWIKSPWTNEWKISMEAFPHQKNMCLAFLNCSNYAYTFEPGEYKLMQYTGLKDKNQYTGLKDKNGVKIFGGDILEWTDGYSKSSGVVAFEEGSFVSKCKLGSSSKIKNKDTGGATTKTFKVIGNIYENPELLNQEK